MAKYGPADVTIEYDSNDVTQYIQQINDVTVEQAVEEVHALGSAWESYLPVGVGKIGAIELSGLYDDTASTGPDALFSIGNTPDGPSTAAKTLVITWGGSKTTTVSVFRVSYARKADRNGLTKFSVKLQPTGAPTEA